MDKLFLYSVLKLKCHHVLFLFFFLIFTVRLFFSVRCEAETVYLLLNSVTETFLGDSEIFLMKGIEIKVHSFNFILKVKL